MGSRELRPLRWAQDVQQWDSGQMEDMPESVRRFWTTSFDHYYHFDYETTLEGHLLKGVEPYQMTLLTSSEIDGQKLPFKDGDLVGFVGASEDVKFPGSSTAESWPCIYFPLKMNKDPLAASDALGDFKVSLERVNVRAFVESDESAQYSGTCNHLGRGDVMLGVTLTRYCAAGKLPSNSRVQVLINVVLQRTYSKCDKVRIKIQRSEGWKLLNEVDESGDVDLTGQDGSTPAHASVLKKSSPYFQALLSERWFRGMSSEEKRELPLPVPADGETVKSFLKCLYGVPVVLQVLEWRGTSMFEDVYQLADACSARQVCFQIAECVQMTETNIPWWIEWLKEEHPQNEYKPIKRRVCEFMQKHFAARWDCFEPDTLRALWGMNQGDRVAQERLKCALKERKSASDG